MEGTATVIYRSKMTHGSSNNVYGSEYQEKVNCKFYLFIRQNPPCRLSGIF